MEGMQHRIGDEPRIIESEKFRFVVSNEYVAFGIGGAQVFETEGPLKERRIASGGKVGDDMTPLSENEWSAFIRMLPTWVEFQFWGGNDPDLHCRIELRENVPRVAEFGWRATKSQQEIRQKHLRAITVENIAHMVYGLWVIELRDVTRDNAGEAIRVELGGDQDRLIRGLLHDMRAGRRHVNAEMLRQVAEVYRANFDAAPAEAVARTFGVKPRMAHEYVRRARERGFLPPTTQGKKKA
jgi:hypothetical protein